MTQEPRVDDGDPHAQPGTSAPAATVTTDVPPAAGAPLGGPTPPPGQAPGSASGSAPGSVPGPVPGQVPGQNGPEGLARFFDRIRAFGAVRPVEGRWFAGCCAAVARRTGVDAVLVRGILVVTVLLGGAGVFLYALAWLLLPGEDGRIHAQELVAGRASAPAIWATVICVLSLGSSSFVHDGWFLGTGWVPGIVWVGLIVAGVVYWASRHDQNPPAWMTRDRVQPPAGTLGAPAWAAPAPGAAAPGVPSAAAPSPGTAGASAWPTTASAWSPAVAAPPAPPAPTAPVPPPAWASAPAWTPPPAVSVPVPAPRPPRPPDLHQPLHALSMATAGLALLAAAAVGGWDRAVGDVPGNLLVACLAVALVVVGLGVVAAGFLGRRSGGLAPLGILLAVALLPAALLADNEDTRLFGEQTVQLTSASVDADRETDAIDLGAGRLVLDLTDPGLARAAAGGRPVQVTARVGAGRLIVRVPEGIAVDIRSQVGVGSLRQEDPVTNDDVDLGSGTGLDRVDTFGSGTPVITVDAQVGLGELRIEAPQAEASRTEAPQIEEMAP
ncbi:MAG: PspC domain-containing protein [Kineosporiaceae bacterium]